MWTSPTLPARLALAIPVAICLAASAMAGEWRQPRRCIYREQRDLQHRSPGELSRIPVPELPPPPTVSQPQADRTTYYLSLDEALRIALANSEVVRVLVGTTATSTGQTIYDPAIVNTQIDQAQAVFDPQLDIENTFDRSEDPGILIDSLDRPRVAGRDLDLYRFGLDLSRTNPHGGRASLGVTAIPQDIGDIDPTFGLGDPLLNPSTPSAVEFAYVHPLLSGRGLAVNTAPITIARIDTERSYYQLKGAVQDLVQSVIAGYWGIVFARTDVWARKQQVSQLEFALRRFEARRVAGTADMGDISQARVSLANFRASLIGAEADLLNREAAFRNVLGLPPSSEVHFLPSTTPLRERIEPDWPRLLSTAEQNRPDLILAKLAIEADRQFLLIANNDALPELDAVGLYRMNALGGKLQDGSTISSRAGQFTDWRLGLNLTVPLGLRAERAALRQQELTLSRDRANLQQQFHFVTHELAQNVRNLAQFYEQYEAFRRVREASRVNLDFRFRVFDVGGLRTDPATYVDVLLAITDWGNAVSAEAQTLTAYNTELATLQAQVGTILEDHGIRFLEDRFASMGPLGRLANCVYYPESIAPGPNEPLYGSGDQPAESSFDLKPPIPDLGDRGAQPSSDDSTPPERLPLNGPGVVPAVPPLRPAARSGPLPPRVDDANPEKRRLPDP